MTNLRWELNILKILLHKETSIKDWNLNAARQIMGQRRNQVLMRSWPATVGFSRFLPRDRFLFREIHPVQVRLHPPRTAGTPPALGSQVMGCATKTLWPYRRTRGPCLAPDAACGSSILHDPCNQSQLSAFIPDPHPPNNTASLQTASTTYRILVRSMMLPACRLPAFASKQP